MSLKVWNLGYRESSARFEDVKFTNWQLKHVYVRHHVGVEVQRPEGYYAIFQDTLLLGNRNQTLLNRSRSMTVIIMLVSRKSALYNQQYHQLGTRPRSIQNISFTMIVRKGTVTSNLHHKPVQRDATIFLLNKKDDKRRQEILTNNFYVCFSNINKLN